MDSNLPQSSNMDTPIEGTPTGILIVVSFIQLEYSQPVITQYFANNKSEIWS